MRKAEGAAAMDKSIAVTLALVSLLFCGGSEAMARNLTWDGAGDGHSWNSSNNWGGVYAPGYTDTLNITTTNTIDTLKRSGGSNYGSGQTWRGVVYLNQGTISLNHQFQSGSNGRFDIGDGSGTDDAIFNILSGGHWMFDRHHYGTYTININSDGQLNATGTGRFSDGHYTRRNWTMNVRGGSVTSEAAWTINSQSNTNRSTVTLSLGGKVDVGAITVGSLDVIDFVDVAVANSFTADYGGSFADFAAVNAALGTTFTASGGGVLHARDKSGTSFAVRVVPPGTVGVVR